MVFPFNFNNQNPSELPLSLLNLIPDRFFHTFLNWQQMVEGIQMPAIICR
jgi:hypothetical protein